MISKSEARKKMIFRKEVADAVIARHTLNLRKQPSGIPELAIIMITFVWMTLMTENNEEAHVWSQKCCSNVWTTFTKISGPRSLLAEAPDLLLWRRLRIRSTLISFPTDGFASLLLGFTIMFRDYLLCGSCLWQQTGKFWASDVLCVLENHFSHRFNDYSW